MTRPISAIVLAAGLTWLSTGSALAGEHCLLDNGVVFTCTFQAGAKRVEVCDKLETDEQDASYVFFEPGKTPELVLERSYSEIGTMPWNGMGMAEWNAVTFMSGAYAYEVFAEHPRSADAVAQGSLTVSKNGEVLVELACDEGSVEDDLFGFIDKIETAAGQN